MSIADKLLTIAENEQKVYNAGYWEGYYGYHNEFWDAFQVNGTRTDYHMAFSGGGWTDMIFQPKYDLILSAYGGYNTSHLSCTCSTESQYQTRVKLHGVFPSWRG